MDNVSGNTGCNFGIDVRMNKTKLTNMIVSGFGQRNLIRKGEMFIKNEAPRL